MKNVSPLRIKTGPSVAWINIDGIHQSEILGKLGEGFGLHPLVVEDILNTDQRPKIEEFEGYNYIVLKMLQFHGNDGEIIAEQVSLILGPNFVISFQEKEVDIFHAIRESLRTNKGRIRKIGQATLRIACSMQLLTTTSRSWKRWEKR